MPCNANVSTVPVGRVHLFDQAVIAIADGALDEATETELAARLGVSARHLRRIFVARIGMTPSRLAQTVRTHRARVLLAADGMRITDVAFAAGFQSVRQFNRAMRERFDATPRELRARFSSASSSERATRAVAR